MTPSVRPESADIKNGPCTRALPLTCPTWRSSRIPRHTPANHDRAGPERIGNISLAILSGNFDVYHSKTAHLVHTRRFVRISEGELPKRAHTSESGARTQQVADASAQRRNRRGLATRERTSGDTCRACATAHDRDAVWRLPPIGSDRFRVFGWRGDGSNPLTQAERRATRGTRRAGKH